MPATQFICPDGQKTPIEACLSDCRMGTRCMSLPTLRCIAYDRPLRDEVKVSASQAGTGVRYMYLREKHNFAVDPMSRVYALFGTGTHLKLEAKTEGEMLSEVFLESKWTCGTLDLYDGPSRTLIDYKTWGSYKCAKSIGLVEHKIPDPTGAVYQRNGRGYKKGDPKMIKIWEVDPDQVDMWETEIQLNAYRIMLEEINFPVDHMFVEAIVRDGNTFTAKSRGVDRPLYHIPVAKIEDIDVMDFFKMKTLALRDALATDTPPPYCNETERWDGRKCNGYCDVAEICNPPWLEEKAA